MENQRKDLTNLINAIEAFRDVDPLFPPQTMLTFLTLCKGPPDGMAMADIAAKLDRTQASASRNIMALSDVNRRKEEGYSLIEAFHDPLDFRRKMARLTPKGKRLKEQLLRYFVIALAPIDRYPGP